VLLVGHSFGGQALGLAPSGDQLSGVLTVGAQLGWYGHWPTRPARLRLLATWSVAVPVLTALYGYLPGWAGTVEDLPAGVAREWAAWCRSPGYLIDLVTDAEARFASVEAPATVLAILDDDYAPAPAVRAFAALLPRATVRQVGPADAGTDHIGHFGFFRPRCRALWSDAAEQLRTWATTPAEAGLVPLRLARRAS
jgi:predicted alpha/beta hydrolase